jgi:hypothetical protein
VTWREIHKHSHGPETTRCARFDGQHQFFQRLAERDVLDGFFSAKEIALSLSKASSGESLLSTIYRAFSTSEPCIGQWRSSESG